MFLRGGLRGGEGGGHGGDCAPPLIVPGLGLGPRATGTAIVEPPPLWAGLGGAGDTKEGRRARVPAVLGPRRRRSPRGCRRETGWGGVAASGRALL